MAIPNIANIRVGLPNESVNSDSLFTAFTKTRDNFNTLANLASPYNTFTGNGVSVDTDADAGTVDITNTGVTSIVAGTGVSISSANGEVTISSNGGGNGGSGTVTSVSIQSPNATLNVSGTIVSAGSLNVDLQQVGNISGEYRAPNITVDSYGRVTSIANGNLGITSLAIIPGAGIGVENSPATANASNITIRNTGVTRLNAGSGIALSGSNGNVTVGLTGAVGSVTSVGITSNTLAVANSPIITSGTISINLPNTISLSGNITGGNLITSGLITATGNIAGGNLRTSGALSASGNITGGNVIGSLHVGNLSGTGNSNVGNIGATNGVFTNISGNGSSLTSITGANVTGTVANATFATSAGSATTATTAGSATTAGTVTTAAQPNITSVGTLTSLTISGNTIIGNNLFVNGNLVYINVDTLQVKDPIINLGGGPNGDPLTTNDGKDRGLLLNYYNTTPVSAFMGWDNSNAEFALGSNVSVSSEIITYNELGNVRASTFIGNLSGSLLTANQPNITSVGTLSSLSVSGNANVGTIISTLGEIDSLKSFWINRDDSSFEGGQITFRKAVDNTDAWALDVYGNTSNTQFRIIDSATGIAKLTIDKTFPGNLSTPNDVSIGNPVLIGSVNNIRKITAGIFQTSSGTAVAPTSPNSNPLFTMDLSAVGFFSKWLITVMPGFETTNNDLVNWLTATFELAVVVNTLGPTYTFSKLTNNVNFINLEFTFTSVTLTTKITNTIGGMDVGDYPVLWSALRLI